MEVHDFGQLGLIVLESCRELGMKVDYFIKTMRENSGDEVDSYMVPIQEIRFNNGEGKIKLKDTVRGKDIYILCDVGNYSCTYTMFGYITHKGPDEHFKTSSAWYLPSPVRPAGLLLSPLCSTVLASISAMAENHWTALWAFRNWNGWELVLLLLLTRMIQLFKTQFL